MMLAPSRAELNHQAAAVHSGLSNALVRHVAATSD